MKALNAAQTRLWQSMAVACVMGWCSAVTAATIEGVVHLPKPKPPPASPVRYQNNTPGKVGPPPPPAAVVYLEGQFPPVKTTNTATRAQMEQKQFQFVTGLLPVRTGSAVEFPNLDNDYHNVLSFSPSKSFDLGRYRKDEQPAAIVFDKPGVINLYCDIHKHMRATILVLDSPYFVKTDPEGKFRLENLPPGKYTLKAWINEKTVWERQVVLEDGTNLQVEFPST